MSGASTGMGADHAPERRPAHTASAGRRAALNPLLPLETDIRVPLRLIVTMAALLVIFITMSPLTDLADPDRMAASEGRETWTYLTLFAISGAMAALLPRTAWPAIRALMRPANILLVGWLFVSVATSQAPVTSLKRLLLALAVVAIAAAIPLLTRDMRQFARLLAAAALITVVLCFLAVFLTPELAIHQRFDLNEPQLAGDWRGIYGHKNLAAMMMGLFILIAILAMRVGAPLLGTALLIGAGLFLVFSGGKSAPAQVLMALTLSVILPRLTSGWLRALVVFGPLILVNTLTVGSVVSPAIRAILDLLPVDPTFTGRTDVWRFVIETIGAKPIFGWGFLAFWGTGRELVVDAGTEWVGAIANSHNSYLDMALTIGIPGVIVFIVAMLVVPFRDASRAVSAGAPPALTSFFLSLWLLCIYLGSFEAFFFDRADPVWFAMALSVCGLAYLARFRIRAAA